MVKKKAAEPKRSFVDTLDTLFADVSPTDAVIMSAGFIAGTKGYTPISALIKAATGVTDGSATGKLYNIDPMTKLVGTYGALYFGGVPGAIGAYLTMWNKPKEEQTEEEKKTLEAYGDLVALGCIGLIESYAMTRPGTVAGIGEIVKGVGEVIPG